MLIKTKNTEANVPAWLLVLGVLVVDNAIANFCKVKMVKVSSKSKGKES